MSGIIEAAEIEDSGMTYLRHLVISMYGPTQDREVFDKIKKNVGSQGPAIAFLDVLATNARDYTALLNPDHSKWAGYPVGVKDSIRTMLAVRVMVMRPLMLAVIRHFSAREAERAFRLFVCWTVRFLIAGGNRSGTLEKAYSQRANDVSTGRVTTTRGLIDAMGSLVPSDASFEQEFATARVSKNYLARYYLRALELRQKGLKDPELIPNDSIAIDLEHILPSNPGANWRAIEPETAAAIHRRIGNLVLLRASVNSVIGNADFATKKPHFKDSKFILTAQVAEYDQWGVEEINDRQRKLASLAVKTWPIEVK